MIVSDTHRFIFVHIPIYVLEGVDRDPPLRVTRLRGLDMDRGVRVPQWDHDQAGVSPGGAVLDHDLDGVTR